MKKQILWQFTNKPRRYFTDISGIYSDGSIFKSVFENLHITTLNERWGENAREITVRNQEKFQKIKQDLEFNSRKVNSRKVNSSEELIERKLAGDE